MMIALVSEDFHILTGQAERARRFLLFEVEKGHRPRLARYFELPADMPSYDGLHGDDTKPFPLDGMALITSEAGVGFRERLERRGTRVHITSERDPHTAVKLLLEGKLPAAEPQAPERGSLGLIAAGDTAAQAPGPSPARRAPAVICASDELPELGSYGFQVLHRGEPRAAILIRFRGTAYGYLNQCVHMPKALDCEHCNVFDANGEMIRCSMHGITYDPVSGQCQSEICAGKFLTAVKIVERDGFIYLVDKRSNMHS